MSYNFYTQRYPKRYWDSEANDFVVEDGDSEKIDIEETFKCKYVRMEGIGENGKAKNVYSESYAETEELRLHIPQTVLYDNTELALTVIFCPQSDDEMDIQDNERELFEYLSGRLVEYSDTFRNRYVSMILINKPEVVGEVLYGGSRYREVKYTFQNVYGRSFEQSIFENPDIYKPFVLDKSFLDTDAVLS